MIMIFLQVTHVVGLALVAILLSRAGKRNAFGWTAASVCLGLPLVLLSQLPAKGRCRDWPTWKGWLLRCAVGLGLVLILTAMGESGLTRSYGARQAKTKAIAALNVHVRSHAGTVIQTEAGPIDIQTWGRVAFALAACGAILGALMVSRPFLSMGALASAGFVIGTVINIVQESALISAFARSGSIPESMFMYYASGFTVGLFVLFWLAVGLGFASSGSSLRNSGAERWRSRAAGVAAVKPELTDKW